MNKKHKVLLGGVGALALTFMAGAALVSANNTDKQKDFINRVAEIIGVDSQKLSDGFKQASKEEVDQRVKDGKLTQEEADKIKANIDSGNMLRLKGGMGPEKVRFAREDLADLAKFLGVTEDELKENMRNEKTLLDIAKEKGISEESLRKYLSDKHDEHLKTAVAEGKLTQEQADKISENKDEMIDARINGKGPMGKGRMIKREFNEMREFKEIF